MVITRRYYELEVKGFFFEKYLPLAFCVKNDGTIAAYAPGPTIAKYDFFVLVRHVNRGWKVEEHTEYMTSVKCVVSKSDARRMVTNIFSDFVE